MSEGQSVPSPLGAHYLHTLFARAHYTLHAGSLLYMHLLYIYIYRYMSG